MRLAKSKEISIVFSFYPYLSCYIILRLGKRNLLNIHRDNSSEEHIRSRGCPLSGKWDGLETLQRTLVEKGRNRK